MALGPYYPVRALGLGGGAASKSSLVRERDEAGSVDRYGGGSSSRHLSRLNRLPSGWEHDVYGGMGMGVSGLRNYEGDGMYGALGRRGYGHRRGFGRTGDWGDIYD